MRGKLQWKALKVWVLAGCMMVGGLSAAHGATYDATGTWTFTTSGNWVNAGSAGCSADPNDTVTTTIDQSGNSVDVVIKGRTYSGTVSGATYTGTTSYAEDGGTTTVTVRFTLTSNSTGSGTVEWSWSDGYEFCDGGSNIALTKSNSGDVSGSGGGDSGGGGGGSGCFIKSLVGI
jgi:hypothetical protein